MIVPSPHDARERSFVETPEIDALTCAERTPVGITSIEPAALRPDVIATLSVIGASRM